jgi:hypothetical protein
MFSTKQRPLKQVEAKKFRNAKMIYCLIKIPEYNGIMLKRNIVKAITKFQFL